MIYKGERGEMNRHKEEHDMAKSKKKRKTRCFYYSYCFGRFGKIFLQWRADSDLERGKALFEPDSPAVR